MEEELTYYEDNDINELLEELNSLKNAYKNIHLDLHMELYIKKLMVLAQHINIKEYLLENIEKPVIKIMLDLEIKPTPIVINQICEDQELFETYIKYANEKEIRFILLKAPDRVYKFTVNNKPLVEYLFENNLATKDIIDSLIGCEEIFYYLKKYNKEELLNYMNPFDLSVQINNKLLLDSLIESKKKPDFKEMISGYIIELILERKAYYLLENVDEIYLDRKIENTTLFEFLLQKDIISKRAIKIINNGYSKAEYYANKLLQYKRYDILSQLDEPVLTNLYFEGKYALEYILENNLSPNIIYNSKTSLEIILKLNKYEELQKCSQKLLLVKLENGNRVIEEIIKRNLSLNIDDITNQEIAYYIYINNRTDLYNKVRLSTWLMEYDNKSTYLDWIIIESKKNPNIKIKNLKEDKSDLEEKAKIYIMLAKHRIHENYQLTKEDLIMSLNGKTLMQYLLEEDETITLNYLINEDIKNEKEISIIIRLNELRKTQKEYKQYSKNTKKVYLSSLEKSYNFSRTTEDESLLLEELYNVMNDGKSDQDLLYSLISFYTYLFSIKNNCANEVIRLIEIKRNNEEFALIKSSNGNYFSPQFNRLELEDTNPDSISHEIGHALFYNLTDKKIPQEIINKIKELRTNKKFLEKTSNHSNDYYKQRDKIIKMVEDFYMCDYDMYIDDSEKERIKEYLELEEELSDLLGYFKFPGKKLTPEEILRKNRKIQKEELTSFIISVEYGYLLAVSDIIDAIHEGKYQSGELIDQNNEKIIGSAGHGKEYYSRGDIWVIDEIIADISQILKSSSPYEGIKLLKEYIGEELTNMLLKYYEENIIHSKKYEQSIKL